MLPKQPIGRNPKTPEGAFRIVLRTLRRQEDWSQEELAHRSGYNRNYISLLECGRNSPSLKTIFNLSTVFRRKPSDFMAEMEKLLKAK